MSITLSADMKAGTYQLVSSAVPVAANVSADEYQGDALMSVVVDGATLFASLDIAAVHGKATQSVSLGSFAPGSSHTVVFTFLNDAYGGSSATDRNAYVDSYQVGTSAAVSDEQALMSQGSSYTLKFTVPA